MNILNRVNHPLVEIAAGFAPASVVHSLAESGDKLGALTCAGLGAVAILHGIYRYDQSDPDLPDATPSEAVPSDVTD